MNHIKPIAIYLPQFHPIPENDEWWGKGFTEWTNVTKATPRFEGHYQPHLPGDLGFYDLRLEEVRLAQEAMAKKFGLYGFCYYHYWFNGKRMLYEPIERKLKNKEEDFPFMLCWANENWSRSWDGLDKEVLLGQEYSDEDDKVHMEYLCNTFFKDSRYIKHEGKPVFLVYRPKLFKDIKKTIRVWREIAKENGIDEIHLGYMQSWGVSDHPASMGFDFAVEFQPNFPQMPVIQPKIYQRVLKKTLKLLGKGRYPSKSNDKVFDYTKFTELQMQKPYDPIVSPGLIPMWDNSPRRKNNAFVFSGASPIVYGKWLKHIKDNYPWKKNNEKFLFINAWNEWAEGNHLEPCQKWGTQYLEITKKVLSE